MGRRLADELHRFMLSLNELSVIERISFIGHSLGGIIIRAALQYLGDLAEKFHILMTLSTPHLGYRSTKVKLFSTGLWIYKKIIKS